MARSKTKSARTGVSISTSRTNERQNIGRSTIGAARALDRLRSLLPDVVHTPAAKRVARQDETPQKAARLSPSRAATLKEAPARQKLAVPDKPPLREPERDTCKSRPARSSGSGGSRAFVPWCSKRS